MALPETDELFSLLVPLADDRLLLPRACIAEVVAWTELSEMAGAPAWYLGTLAWNEREVPVISFEAACGQHVPVPSGRTRIVLLHCLDGRLSTRVFGIVTQGFPQLVRVTRDVLKLDPTHTYPERSPVICQVRMVNEAPLIPDLQLLESMIADETTVGAV